METPALPEVIDERSFDPDSVQLAYERTIAAYDLAERRLDVVEKRLQDVMAFGITATLAVVALKSGGAAPPNSPLFVGAAVFFLLAVGLGLTTRIRGTLEVLHPSKLYDSYLEVGPTEFRRGIVYWGGQDWAANNALIFSKSNYTVVTATLFVLEFIFLACWAAAGSS